MGIPAFPKLPWLPALPIYGSADDILKAGNRIFSEKVAMIIYGKTEMDYISSKDPVMKELVAHYGHLEAGAPMDIFESLVNHIIGQMISDKVRYVIDGRVRKAAGTMTPEALLALGNEKLRACGLSGRKVEYILGLSRKVKEGSLRFDDFETMRDEEIIKRLTALRGIGTWTAEMIAQFTLGRPDIFCKYDQALKNGMMKAHGFRTLSDLRFNRYKKKYSPCGSIASLYYYAVNDDESGWRPVK